MTRRPHRRRWDELEKLLDELFELAPAARERRLAEIGDQDTELQATLQSLLEAGNDDGSFLEQGAQSIAEEALDGLVGELRSHSKIASGDSASRMIGRYRLLHRIGAGGMGEVWVGERADDVIQQKVAIKLLRPLVGPNAQQRFDRERRILASLQHDGIAKILDAGVEPGTPPYLVLEYVDGTGLIEFCRWNKLGIVERLELFMQVCDAVAHAHRRLIVHRDLKPPNILVNSNGNVKLLDFGIAKLLDPAEYETGDALTRAGLLPVTPEYATPEQILGATITTATDVYGLGNLLYELLTDTRPFDTGGLSPGELEHLVCQTDPPMPSAAAALAGNGRLSKTLRGDLDTIVMTTLQKDPDDRYSSVAALADDINSFLQGLPIRARPATLAYRVGKFVRRHRVAAGTAALLFVAVTAGVLGTLSQKREAQLQKARFESTGEFLFALFEQIDPDLNPGSQLTAVSLLDLGSERLEKFAAGPEARADLLRVLGVLYSKLGERDHGEALLRRAVTEASTHLSSRNNTIGQTMNSLGRYLAERGKLEESERVLREGAAALERAGDDGRWWLSTQFDLARTLYLRGQPLPAIEVLEKSVSRHRALLTDDPRNLMHRSLVEAQTLLGQIQMDLDRFDDAEQTLERTVSMAHERLGDDHPELGRILETLGELHYRSGDSGAAQTKWRAALDVQRRARPGGDHSIAMLLSQLSLIDHANGDIDNASAQMAAALELWNRLPEGTHSERADRFAAAAAWHLLHNEYELARVAQLESLQARRLAHGLGSHWQVADAVQQLGRIELAAGNLEQAGQTLLEAQNHRVAVLGEAHSSVGESLYTRGVLYRRMGFLDKAEQVLEQALEIQLAALPDEHTAIRAAQRELDAIRNNR